MGIREAERTGGRLRRGALCGMAVALVASALAVAPGPSNAATPHSVASAATSASTTLSAASYVNSFTPSTPTNSPDILRTNNDPSHNRIKRSYLRFTVSGVPSGATGITATMVIPAQTTTSNSVQAHVANAGSWTASTLTWNNQPGYSAAVLSAVAPVAGQNASWNVSGSLPASGNGVVSLALDEPASSPSGDVTFNGPATPPIPALNVSWTCGLNSLLVPTCGGQALFGAATDDGQVGAPHTPQSFPNTQVRYSRDFPLWHTYHPAGSLPLKPGTTDGNIEISHAQAGGIPVVNWKPADDWSTATGGNSAVDASIAQAAQYVKAVAPHKIMLSVWHEPEDNVGVSPAGSGCGINGGNPVGNTTANYQAMWSNVESIFAAQGVSNVVWTMIYSGFPAYTCLRNYLWPGNSLVNWVGFDSYQVTDTWANSVGAAYTWFNTHSTSAQSYSSKPYGLFEFGANNTLCTKSGTQQWTYQAYADARSALDAGTYPNLRAYVVFDAAVPITKPCVKIHYYRTNQDNFGTVDPTEQQDFNVLANDPLLQPTVNN